MSKQIEISLSIRQKEDNFKGHVITTDEQKQDAVVLKIATDMLPTTEQHETISKALKMIEQAFK